MTRISGYDYGAAARSPVTMRELDELKATVGWSEDDRDALLRAADLLAGEEEAMVDGWRALIGAEPHLAHWFTHTDGTPNETYKAAVKKRFVRWVSDILTRPLDQDWLDYQHEIGRRHTPAAKNTADGADTPSVVPLRFLLAFAAPTVLAMRERLRAKDVAPDEMDRIDAAWTRAIMLTLTLWTRPYLRNELW